MVKARVAHVVATFPPYWAGTGNVAFHNALELARRGLRVSVLTAATTGGAPDDPSELLVRRLPAVFRVGNAPLIPALLPEIAGFDLIHLHWPFIFGAELTYLACRAGRVPYVVTYHHDLRADLRWQFGPYQAVVGPLVLRRASAVFPVSTDHFARSPMRRYVDPRRTRVTEIPNGVDVAQFRPDVDGQAVRARLGIPSDAVVVGYLGAMDRAHAFKGVPVLLEAFARLPPGAARLLAVGGGDLRIEYQRRADELGIGDRAHWPGIVPAGELAAHVAAMDVLVLPSMGGGAESFGIVLIEAMASGKPAIATDIPGVRRVVDQDLNGFLVPPGDAEALAARLRQVVEDRGLRARLGVHGRNKAVERYDWRRIAERLEGEYDAVLATRRSHP